MLFLHLGNVLCRCPYKERIVCQTTIAKTPNHWSVDDCCLALPPRLWQPRNPEGGEATVIEPDCGDFNEYPQYILVQN